MNNKLSVAIITKNEENNIARCLNSVSWADEIVVVDSGSTDKTVDICEKHSCKIITTDWLGFAKTKQFAVDNCSNDWVLVLDADEEITEPLKIKIELILQNPKFSGYRIKRSSFYLGKLIKHCGWDKDYTLRLFDKNKGKFNEKLVHESIIIKNGKIGIIEEVMLHYTYPTVDLHYAKMEMYSELGAKTLFNKGRRSGISNAVIRGALKFIKMYIVKLGFLDGKTGFILSINSSYGVYLKYLKLSKLNKNKTDE
ncbi:MAG: glycosyltransferase family 2 protein [Candidatus Delongbacteria bacterium]|jgi:glycosyltransferase involved in cell wall biosynthesis|nr:glycosyltransferase family 2 protein [Candidatus Delongbacteria bacterium]